MKSKSARNRGETGKSRSMTKPSEGKHAFPERLKKLGCLYIEGQITHGAHGTWHVDLKNGMNLLASARKMDNLKISLLPGDVVTCEIPALAMNPNETLRGRIVWRDRNQNKHLH